MLHAFCPMHVDPNTHPTASSLNPTACEIAGEATAQDEGHGQHARSGVPAPGFAMRGALGGARLRVSRRSVPKGAWRSGAQEHSSKATEPHSLNSWT